MSTSINGYEINQLRFVVLPGNPLPNFYHKELYNQAYRHYTAIWQRTFNRRAGNGVFNSYDFFRQSFIFVLVLDKAIIAQICGSFLNLDLDITYDLSYFSNFQGKALEVMRAEGARRLMTLEFASVNPAFAPRKVGGICFGEIITHLGYKFGMTFEIDLVTGLPRRLSGTNQKVVNSGYRCIEEARTRCGLSVDVVLGFRGELKPHADPTTHHLIERLWNQKQDLTNKRQSSSRPDFKRSPLDVQI